MAGAFQSDAFQNTAFQVDTSAVGYGAAPRIVAASDASPWVWAVDSRPQIVVASSDKPTSGSAR